MLLSPRDFVRFLDGRLGTVQRIAFVPGEFTARIQAISSDLLISREYAQKLKDKHRLRFEHFQLIQIAIDFGYALLERGDLVFVYLDETVFHEMFVLVLKKAERGQEIWLKTFHRAEASKLKRLLRNGNLLRDHYP
jgi:hypothetical protein